MMFSLNLHSNFQSLSALDSRASTLYVTSQLILRIDRDRGLPKHSPSISEDKLLTLFERLGLQSRMTPGTIVTAKFYC